MVGAHTCSISLINMIFQELVDCIAISLFCLCPETPQMPFQSGTSLTTARSQNARWMTMRLDLLNLFVAPSRVFFDVLISKTNLILSHLFLV